ncbi:MAG: hypothetical protein IPG59_12570 [Candidatus Melainabacteria bacterium]|nr:MAG: hypothetical protein IPG59_12570 [Candidatus Melainabacteria bacterium]
MNGRILGSILCVVFTAAAYLVANSTVYHIPTGAIETIGMGVFLGVVAMYTVAFSAPNLVLSFVKPAFILTVLAAIFVSVGLPPQVWVRESGLVASILAIMAGVGACGGLGYNLGLKLGK